MKIGFWVVEDGHTADVDDGFFVVVVVVLTVVVVHDGLWVTEPTLKNKTLRLGLSWVLQLIVSSFISFLYVPMLNNWDVLCTCIEAESIKIKMKVTWTI